MQAGFLVYGVMLAIGIFINGDPFRSVVILVYAVSIACAGIFCSRPMSEVSVFNPMEDRLHSIFAQMAGIAFTFGI